MKIRKLLAAVLALVMVLAVAPVASLADVVADATYEAAQQNKLATTWAALEAAEAEALKNNMTREEVIKAVYEAALNQENVDKDSFSDFTEDGFFFTVDGMYSAYSYRLHNSPTANPNNKEESEYIYAVVPEQGVVKTTVSDLRGTNCGAAGSPNVLLVGPNYNESCTTPGYYDSSFTDQYMTEARSIATATGGTCTMLGGHNATGPNIAAAYTNKGVVIYDSHGSQSGTSSYLCLTTNSGITTTDYNNGWAVAYGSSEAWIDGRYIQNHISGTLSNCFVWMAICEGMKKAGKGTTGTALLAAGAGGVYGYSQSVSFTGDYKYEATFWTQMKNGATVKSAIQTMKSTWGNWDPAYSSSSGAAWPIVMSAVDAFPSNPDGTQTVNCDWELFGTNYTVTATSNNTNYGTVSVNGYVITASPKTGYYAAGYTVTSGTATVTQNGNTFTVNPSSDCTVRINFAAKTQYTVSFTANGTSQGSQTAYSGDSITLPTSVNVNPDGWTFIGWVAQQVSETTTKPTYYAPSASYNVTGNATLYALYNRLDGEGGETVYQQTDTLEVGGRYVITAGNYAVGNTIYNTSNNHYVTSQSVSINDSTNTLTTSVDINTILYEIESGSASAGYVFKNVGNGQYLTLGSDEYLIVGSNSLAWLWTGSDLNNQIDSEGYYYLARSSNSTYFTTSKNTNGTIVMYGEVTLGTYYYTTSPVASTPTYTVVFKDWDGTVLSTQTVEQGQDAVAPANPTRVGYTFTGWDVAFTNVQSDLIVTAQYTINTYTVTFKDWDGTVLKTQTVNYGGSATPPANPTRVGYTFTGWSGSYTNVTTNVTVIAQYTINTYTVTFKDWDGTTLKTQTVNYGGAATAPSVPGREGYTFIGWDVDFSNVTSDLIVTAQYTENSLEPTLLGDIDLDGQVTAADALLAMRHAMGISTITGQGLVNGDMDGDGVVTSSDAILIMRAAMA